MLPESVSGCGRNTQLKKIADFFHITPEYFYEYRLKKLLDYIDNNREFLDHCLRQSKKYNKDLPEK